MMTHVRFNHSNCMPDRSEYQVPQSFLNWYWNDGGNVYRNDTAPRANIVESKEDYRIELSAPGFSKNEFKITLDGQVLTISGEAGNISDQGSDNFVRREFKRNSFNRSFRLSNALHSEGIVARYENGLLLLTIPKAEEAKSKPTKQIEVA